MATLEQEQAARERLNGLLNEIAEFDLKPMLREDLGVEFSFVELRPYWERLIQLYDELRACTLDGAPYPSLTEVSDNADTIVGIHREIKDFSITKNLQNAVNNRNRLLNNAHSLYDTSYPIIKRFISMQAQTDSSAANTREEIRKLLNEIEDTKNQQIEAGKATMVELKSVLEHARGAAAEVGVSQHAVYFNETAQQHEKGAHKWLVASVTIGLLTLIVAGISIALFLNYADKFTTVGISIQVTIGKIIIFSILFWALALATKNYRSHWHNFVVNKHRQNALSTFQTFASSSTDAETKNAVLLRSTETIFSPASSGYMGKESDHSGTPQIMEIFRGVMNKPPGSGGT